MHLGNGAITPQCAVVTFAAAGAGLGIAAQALRRTQLDRERLITTSAITCAVFSAQLINISVLPVSSAHLVGGVLAALVLGPSLGAWAMTAILVCQALLLGDGGLTSLGANILNMALLPASLVALYRQKPSLGRAALTAAAAVIGAAGLIVVEVALFRKPSQLGNWGPFAIQMLSIHLWIASLEGVVTAALLSALRVKIKTGCIRFDGLRIAASFGAAAFLIISWLPLASQLPDGYEASAERSGMNALLSQDRAEIAAVGTLNAMASDIQTQFVVGVQNLLVSDQIMALAAAVVASLLAVVFVQILTRHARNFV